MGNKNSKPKRLNLDSKGRDHAQAGHLFGTIDDVWNSGVLASCEGAFDRLAQLRQGNDKAPKHARELAEVCCDAWDNFAEEEARKNFLTKKMDDQFHDYWTSVTELSVTGLSKEPKGRNTENVSKAERRAADTIINMFGETEKHSKTRAHLLPNSPACLVFWGMVCEAVSGINLDGCSKDKKMFVRTEMATWLRRFKVNLFAFAAPHNSFYDLLEDDQCVMIIPLLSLEQIAEWKEGDGYEVLFCCSRKAQKKFGMWSMDYDLNHIKWEGDGDLEKATSVLTAHVKALGDSLNQHWDSFFTNVTSDHQEFETNKSHINAAKELLEENNGQVEVPDLKRFLDCTGRKKFFKIDLAELYEGDFQMRIPDPSLFCFKAAVNWSGRTPETRLRKLLSCCSPEEESDEESYLSRVPSNVSFTDAIAAMTGEVDVEQSAIKYGEQLDSALLYREIEVNYYVSESEDDYSISDVSSLGSNEMGELI